MTARLTEHFTWEEMTDSESHPELVSVNRIQAVNFRDKLVMVCEQLEMLRSYIARQIFINSGFRGPELNKAVGGVPTSQHTKGEAADFVVKDFTEDKALYIIYGWCKDNLDYSQLIFERPAGRTPWIHLGLPREDKPKECLVYENGSYIRI